MGKQAVVVRRGKAETLQVMGTEVSFLCEAESTNRSFSIMEAVLPRDSGPPPHEHPWDEAYYVLAGDVRFKLGERELTVSAGDFLYAPGGTVHAFHGASDEPARVLVFDAPAAAEAFFRDVDREVKDLQRDMAKVPEIGRRHRLRFLVPGASSD